MPEDDITYIDGIGLRRVLNTYRALQFTGALLRGLSGWKGWHTDLLISRGDDTASNCGSSSRHDDSKGEGSVQTSSMMPELHEGDERGGFMKTLYDKYHHGGLFIQRMEPGGVSERRKSTNPGAMPVLEM
jgi:hypothetical protein